MAVFMTQSLICEDGKEACLCPKNTICMVLSYPQHACYVTTSICWINTRRNVYYKKKPFTNTFAFSDPDKEVKPRVITTNLFRHRWERPGNVSQFYIDAITLIIVAKDSFQTLFSPHTETTVSLFFKSFCGVFFLVKIKLSISFMSPRNHRWWKSAVWKRFLKCVFNSFYMFEKSVILRCNYGDCKPTLDLPSPFAPVVQGPNAWSVGSADW